MEDYPLVMPIRLLRLLETGGRVLRDRVARLMDHGEARAADTEAAAWTEARVVRPLLALPGHSWTRDMVLRAVGIFRTNACTSQVSGQLYSTVQYCTVLYCTVLQVGGSSVRMLYPSMAILSHSCCPNTQALHRPGYGLTLTATRDIRYQPTIA